MACFTLDVIKPELDFEWEAVRNKEEEFIRRYVIGDDAREQNKREAVP